MIELTTGDGPETLPSMAKFDPNALGRIADKKGLSRSRVAKELGVSVSTVSGWYSGKVSPRLDQAVIIADMLGIGLHELAGVAPSPDPANDEEREVLALVREIGVVDSRRRLLLIPEAIKVGRARRKPRDDGGGA